MILTGTFSVHREPWVIGPQDTMFRINLAFCEVARGNHSEAIRELQIVEELQPDAYRLSQISLIYTLAGRREDAVRVFSEFESKADANNPHWLGHI